MLVIMLINNQLPINKQFCTVRWLYCIYAVGDIQRLDGDYVRCHWLQRCKFCCDL